MTFAEIEKKVKLLIAKDDIGKALDELINFLIDDPQLDKILLLSASYNNIIKNQIQGTAEKAELNQLRANLLGVLRSLREEDEDAQNAFPSARKTQNVDDSEGIKVFLSIATPHNDLQKNYISKVEQHLKKYGIELVTLQDWNSQDPLKPILQLMKSTYGCLVLVLERYYIREGVTKRGSAKEAVLNGEAFASPWNHIEAALANQLNLPLLILKEEKLKSEGMIDESVFEWRIVKIDPEKPEQLDQYPIKQFIRTWVEEVKKMKNE